MGVVYAPLVRGRALVAVAIAVVCGLVVAFGSGLAATGRKQRVSSACKIVSVPVLHPRLSPSAPPVALSSILGVLRRPRTSVSELPPGGAPLLGYSVLWVNYIHLLATGPDQTRYFLTPGIIDIHISAECLRSLSPLSANVV